MDVGAADDTLWALLARQAAARPDAPALRAGGDVESYAALAARAERLARAFAALGIGRGDVVSAQLANDPDFVAAYLALARLGAVLSTIHLPYRAGEARDLMRAARSKAVLCRAEWHGHAPARELLGVQAELPDLRHVIVAGGAAPPGALALDRLDAGDTALPPAPDASAPFLLLFTSGTSARPKGVRAEYRRFLPNARLNAAEMGIGPDSAILSAAPYTHLLGLLTLHMALSTGAATVLLPEFAPDAFVAALAAGRPTHVVTAPAHVAACEAQRLLSADALASVRFFAVSGAMAPPDLYRGLERHLPNGTVAQVWGMTELQCGIFHRPGDPIERVATTCGRPAPGFEARAAGPDGAALPAGEEGELQVRGISVFAGYHENPAATAEAFTADGWFRTGDLAVIGADGYVAITGRLKDVVNRGGVKINPVDVEACLARHPAVAQCAIAPVPDPVLGERACAYVVPTPGAAPTLDDLRDWLAAAGIAKIRWPERLELIAEMPLTPTRKVIKGRLRPAAP
jgi:cyclohexanecarboxylate-CoA ligase